MFVYISIVFFAIITCCQNQVASEWKGNGHVCTGDDCQHFGVIIGSVIGAHILLILLIIGLVCCCKRYKGNPFRSNSRFVSKKSIKNTEVEMHDLTIFQSGLWSIRYLQNKKWFGPYSVSLSFDSSLSKVTGTGRDGIGSYTLDGIYSVKTHRIGFTKTYESNTVIIQLIWNEKSRQFEGKWYGKTGNFIGKDKFELKFEKNSDA